MAVLMAAHQAFYALRRAGDLPMFVIYDHPADHPGGFIARLWRVLPDNIPTGVTLTAGTLEELRSMMPADSVRITRAPEDEPQILETWL